MRHGGHVSPYDLGMSGRVELLESRACDLKLKDKDQEEHIEEKIDKGSALQTQIADLLAVLRECDEVDQLVLRNTGMTDELLEVLTKALIESQSEIETINLNLNNLSSAAAHDIVLLLKAKPSLKRLLLFGNEMGDEGITELMSGLSDLLKRDKDNSKMQTSPTTENNPSKSLNLIELDIGGNKLTSKGLWSVASFVRMNPPIQYLGLAQNNIESLEGWMEFFDSMKINTNITHMLLDENNLGDEGTRLLADMLKVNQSLTKIDLDSNNIGEDGAAAIIESLTTNTHSFLVQVSLDENRLCADTRDKINELLTQNF
ncbi:ribonuclease inhibitor-like [Lissotriton helveticus]